MKYYMHRIQKSNNETQKGIEVHDTLDSAKLSFWGRMKTAYDKTDNYFVSCMITDEYGNPVPDYSMTWLRDGYEGENAYFLHHIRNDGDSVDKNIDELESLYLATGNLAEMMEYGYNNSKFPNVSFVHCLITDLLSGGMVLLDREWHKEVEPAPAE